MCRLRVFEEVNSTSLKAWFGFGATVLNAWFGFRASEFQLFRV